MTTLLKFQSPEGPIFKESYAPVVTSGRDIWRNYRVSVDRITLVSTRFDASWDSFSTFVAA